MILEQKQKLKKANSEKIAVAAQRRAAEAGEIISQRLLVILEYVSMWTSCLEDLPQLLILIILEVVLQVTNARGDIAHAPNPDGFVETVKITVKQVNSILGSQLVVWAKLTISLAQLLRTFHLLRTSDIVEFMEAQHEKKMGPNFKLRT